MTRKYDINITANEMYEENWKLQTIRLKKERIFEKNWKANRPSNLYKINILIGNDVQYGWNITEQQNKL